jgi:hypothetical protein
MRSRLPIAIAVVLAGAILVAPAASGDGGPGPGVTYGWAGIESGGVRYVTVPAGGWTTVQVIQRNGGRVVRFTNLKGTWGIPIVANDGTTAGLLRDRRTLLLAQARTNPTLRKYSSFILLDTKKMRVLRTIRVKGDHSFDALSPDARYLYLVEYVSQSDFSRYRVRAYDMSADRLLPAPVVDKRESESTMQGSPVSRATPSDSGWVYTLYGGPHESFIHALDTRNVTAICIDMPWKKQPKRLFEFRLRLDGEGRLVVRGPRGRPLAVIERGGHRLVSSVRNP